MKRSDNEFSLEDWANTEPEPFDLNAEYDEQVQPIVDLLHDKCEELGMPFHFRCVTKQGDGKAESSTTQHLVGVSRATKELIAYNMLENFTMDTTQELEMLVSACQHKFNHLGKH